MARHPPTPCDSERPFAHGELFFSTTDRKGIIRGGNDVFVRVSGYPADVLIGSPHNIIRHPDMPRAVFKLLWDALGEGKSFAGYVKNMAADGRYYWVMALVVPIDDGYLSIRFKPSGPHFAAVKQLYAEMLQIERQAGPAAWREGIRGATDRLGAALRPLGFRSYDEFMSAALASELALHSAGAGPHGSRAAADERSRQDPGRLQDMLGASREADRVLGEAFARVDAVARTITSLDARAGFLHELASKMHFVSLNALLASCRLQRGGEGLSVVTQDLAELSRESTGTIGSMTERLLGLTSCLRETALGVTAAKLQVEMTVFFLHELRATAALDASHGNAGRRRHDVLTLASSISATTVRLAEALPRAQALLPGLLRLQATLATDLRRLSSVHIIGRIQAAGSDEETHFRELLEEISEQLARASIELDEITSGISAVGASQLPALLKDAGSARGIATRLARLAASSGEAA